MGIRLKRAGYEFTIYERSDGVGGTWRDNTLPGRRLRRAVAPLLVLVRAEPVVEPHLRHAARDPPLPRALRRPVRPRAPPPPRHRASPRPAGTRTPSSGTSSPRAGERFAADVLVSALGMLNVPVVPDLAGRRPLPRPDLPLVALGPQQAARRRAGRLDRHRGRARSSTCRRSRPRSSTSPCSSARRSGSRPASTSPTRDEEQRRFARVPFAARLPPLEDLVDLRAGELRRGVRADRDDDRAGPLLPRAQDRRPRPPGQAHAGLPGRVQAAADLAGLVPGADPTERPARHRADRRDHRARHPHDRRRGARARHDHLRHRVPGQRVPQRDRRLRPRRPPAPGRVA